MQGIVLMGMEGGIAVGRDEGLEEWR